ncbi:MAG TPA: response regulator transcription factor, partial [Anaerolineales bacterium]|nr:response regulator transcription factor [Anaerolineales bacterium]
VGVASDGLQAIQKAEELQPDVILLDVGLPKLNGIEAARRIRKVAPNSKILFLSQEIDVDVARVALGDGHGYVVKSDANNELFAAVDAVMQGKKFVSRRLASPISPSMWTHKPPSSSAAKRLSHRPSCPSWKKERSDVAMRFNFILMTHVF